MRAPSTSSRREHPVKRARGVLASSAFLVLLLASIHTAAAQVETGSLSGIAVDGEGDPLAGVTITLSGPGLPQGRQTTDAEGRFELSDLPAGSYRLRAELAGFKTLADFEIPVRPARREEIAILLPQATSSQEARVRIRRLLKSAPPPPPEPRPMPRPTSRPAFDGKNYVELEVFYGTDRYPTGAEDPAEYFGPDRSRAKNLHLGLCRVSIPRVHRAGMIEEPSIWKLEFRPDPDRHMILLGLNPLTRSGFYKRMQGTLQKSRNREVLVFVHGFNVPFKDAALRTAQLAYDLRLDGAPVVYSWPSQASLAKYKVDENNAEWTIPHLEGFLWDLSRQSGANSIYLIAHSMGNRPLTRALQSMAAKLTTPGAKPPFTEILLTAPDIDAAVFADLARVFRKTGERVTLYASSNDRALIASKQVNGYPRAGDSGPDIVVIPEVETVDVSSVDTSLLGHSYYGDNCSVLSDIFKLLRGRHPPPQRGLERKEKNGLAYWVVRAASDCLR